MKILLAAINAKYIHSNLAVHSLRKYGQAKTGQDIELAEYTINQPLHKILADIAARPADLIFFSCYIWNIRQVESLVSDLHKIRPEVQIWLGGPEVSHHAEETLEKVPGARGIIRGEGEEAFSKIIAGEPLGEICDLTYRDEKGQIASNEQGPRMDFSQIPFPYDDLEDFDNRIIYYESSRGCPFRCSYCLSSVDKKLAFRDLDMVKEELQFFMDRQVMQVKFIDRTFNCQHDRTREIWNYIKEHDNGITNFHFEIAADLITDEEIRILSEMRPGLVQLEIGVQSTNPDTIREINRPMDFGKVSRAVKQIQRQGNVHVHLDLIAGLPYEDACSFRQSFNDVFALRPHQLQLGFLKVLKGSPMESGREEYGLAYTDLPPYEVLKTRWISYDQLSQLKAVEEMVDSYYNTGQFTRSLDHLFESGGLQDEFAIFQGLADYYREQGLDKLKMSRNSQYENLLKFAAQILSAEDMPAFRDALVYDYYARDNVKSRPEFLGPEPVSKEFLKDYYAGFEDSRAARRDTHIEKIGGRLMLFDYSRRDPVTRNVAAVEL